MEDGSSHRESRSREVGRSTVPGPGGWCGRVVAAWRVAGSGSRWPVLWCLVLPCRRWRAAACQGPSPGRAGAKAGTRRRRRRPSGVGALGNCNLGEKTACLWASRELAGRVVGMCCVWASKWAGPEIGKLKKNLGRTPGHGPGGPGCASAPGCHTHTHTNNS